MTWQISTEDFTRHPNAGLVFRFLNSRLQGHWDVEVTKKIDVEITMRGRLTTVSASIATPRAKQSPQFGLAWMRCPLL